MTNNVTMFTVNTNSERERHTPTVRYTTKKQVNMTNNVTMFMANTNLERETHNALHN